MRVLYFGPARDLMGRDSEAVPLEAPATVEQVLHWVEESHPAAVSLLSTSVVAVNLQYVDNRATVNDGDEIAIIPPVSGG